MSGEQYRATLEVDELLTELKRLLARQRQTNRLICRYLADLADGLGQWPGLLLAYGDVYNLARRQLGLTIRSIRERIRVGRALRLLPVLEQALVSGNLTYSRVREVTRVAQPSDETYWLTAARELSMRGLEQLVSRHMSAEPPAGATPSPDMREEQSFRELRLKLPPSTWSLLKRALENARQASDRPVTNAEAFSAVLHAALLQQELTQTGSPTSSATPSRNARGTDDTAETPTAETTAETLNVDGTLTSGSALDTGRGISVDSSPSRRGMRADHNARPDDLPQANSGAHEGASKSSRSPVTQSGSSNEHTTLPQSPVTQRGSTQSGSYTSGTVDEDDKETILNLVRGGGVWTLATICDQTGWSPSRVANAMTELEIARSVRRDWCGVVELVSNRPGPRGGNTKRRWKRAS